MPSSVDIAQLTAQLIGLRERVVRMGTRAQQMQRELIQCKAENAALKRLLKDGEVEDGVSVAPSKAGSVRQEATEGAGDSAQKIPKRISKQEQTDITRPTESDSSPGWTAESWLRSTELLAILGEHLMNSANPALQSEDERIKSLSNSQVSDAISAAKKVKWSRLS